MDLESNLLILEVEFYLSLEGILEIGNYLQTLSKIEFNFF